MPADDREHELTFEVDVTRSSWIALPHAAAAMNPVVIVNNPIHASKKAPVALRIDQLWRVRASEISKEERPEAERVFEWAKERYRKIAEESPD